MVFAAVACVFMILIPRSDHESIATAIPRQYTRCSASPIDTIAVPGGIHAFCVFNNELYTWNQGDGTLYRTGPSTTGIPFAKARPYFGEIPTSIQVDSSGAWLYTGNQQTIFHFNGSNPLPDSISTKSPRLFRGTRLQNGQYFIQHYNKKTKQSELRLVNYPDATQSITLHRFPQFDDAGLVADGHIVRSPGNSHIIFAQTHNADMICWDPATGKTSTFQTIDRTPPINTIIRHQNGHSISSKTMFINNSGATDGKYFYMLSSAVSGTETFNGPEVDVYRLPGGEYTGSLRLPLLNRRSAHHIQVENGKLYAAYDNQCIIFQLNLP